MKSYSYLSRLPSNLVGVRKGTILIQNFIMLENLKKSPGLDNDMDSEMANWKITFWVRTLFLNGLDNGMGSELPLPLENNGLGQDVIFKNKWTK